MPTCFVIQPFDGGKYDKRFKDVFDPAIRATGLEPYRVDLDPRSEVVIADIEKGIEDSAICLAEISEDNPNVWYEIGFAYASRKPVLLVAGPERTKFPFDIGHRSILRYKSESKSDFETLGRDITSRLKGLLERRDGLRAIENTPNASLHGLKPIEIAALALVAESATSHPHPVSGWIVQRGMSNAGFTEVAASLALISLSRKGLLAREETSDRSGYTEEVLIGYRLTEHGEVWLTENTELLQLHKSDPSPRKRGRSDDYESISEDDIPF